MGLAQYWHPAAIPKMRQVRIGVQGLNPQHYTGASRAEINNHAADNTCP
jgi:hypothetical protein